MCFALTSDVCATARPLLLGGGGFSLSRVCVPNCSGGEDGSSGNLAKGGRERLAGDVVSHWCACRTVVVMAMGAAAIWRKKVEERKRKGAERGDSLCYACKSLIAVETGAAAMQRKEAETGWQ